MSKVFHSQGSQVETPSRGTEYSAGYDLRAAEDTVIPSLWGSVFAVVNSEEDFSLEPKTLDENAAFNKEHGIAATLVKTGYSIELEDDEYAMVVPRSSVGFKQLLMMPNSVGVIDKDFHPNAIQVPLINLSPNPVIIKKGERFAQVIIHKYGVVENDTASGKRDGGFGHTGRE